jgi:hypothetical protein
MHDAKNTQIQLVVECTTPKTPSRRPLPARPPTSSASITRHARKTANTINAKRETKHDETTKPHLHAPANTGTEREGRVQLHHSCIFRSIKRIF